MRLPSLCIFVSVLSLLPGSTLASVLAIDYGADWIKASLMKPGLPFDVLLNKDSKRKVQSSVAWKNDDRLFGTDAFNLASRYPLDTFSSIKYLQAAPIKSDAVSFFKTISTADVVETSRNTVALRSSDGSEWSPEELIGMQFAYIKSLAESLAGEKVYDAVVTVPPFYSQFERDAVADAIEIAGLRTLALINDGTAVAINYAMTRSFPTPEYHVIYDAGASAIRATVVQFSADNTSRDDTSGTHISVAGVGYDRTAGGNELDRRLRELLIANFQRKHKRDIRGDKKAMAKLWKEAGRIKAILSANSDATATIESLMSDIDFRTKITRSAFENACEDLNDRFTQPIHDALNNAGLTMDSISSVILTGGSTRTPMIQAAVKEAVGEDKIALNVNADEAAVLGAAFHGASLSSQFKTKSVKLSDIGTHAIQASYLSAGISSPSNPRTISTVLFPPGAKVGSKKTLTFKRKEDFSLRLDYKNSVSPGFPTQILEAEITGVSEALANLTELGAIDPVVKAMVRLSESGFVSVPEAVAHGEIIDDSIAGKIKGLFSGGSSTNPDEETFSADNVPARDHGVDPESSSSSPSSDIVAEKISVSKEALKDLSTIPLNVTVKFTSIPPMSLEEKRQSRNRLRAIEQHEALKQRREEARNNLESYLYRVRDLLDDDNPDTPFKKCSQELERKEIARKLEDSITWLHDKGDYADTAQLLDKRNALEVLERPIIHRYQEIEAFPQALNNSQMWNWSTRLFLTEARMNLTGELAAGRPSKWTREELDGLEKALKEHEAWLGEWVEKQKSVKRNEDPVISTTEMKARAKTLETHFQRLVKRKVPKPRAKTSTSSTAAPTSTSSEDADTQTSAAEPTADTTDVPLRVQGDRHDEL